MLVGVYSVVVVDFDCLDLETPGKKYIYGHRDDTYMDFYAKPLNFSIRRVHTHGIEENVQCMELPFIPRLKIGLFF